MNNTDTVLVRYIVTDVDSALDFYTTQLGFAELMHPAPGFAMLARGALRLALSAPGGPGGGGHATHDGRQPEPGGWNRISVRPGGGCFGPARHVADAAPAIVRLVAFLGRDVPAA